MIALNRIEFGPTVAMFYVNYDQKFSRYQRQEWERKRSKGEWESEPILVAIMSRDCLKLISTYVTSDIKLNEKWILKLDSGEQNIMWFASEVCFLWLCMVCLQNEDKNLDIGSNLLSRHRIPLRFFSSYNSYLFLWYIIKSEQIMCGLSWGLSWGQSWGWLQSLIQTLCHSMP